MEEGFSKLFAELSNRISRLEDHQEKQNDIIQIHEAKLWLLCKDGVDDGPDASD